MKKIEVQLQRAPGDAVRVGQLAEHAHRVYFEYAPEFVATGMQPSPFKLPLQTGLIEHRDRDFGPLPGLFEESLPDGWGRLLIDRHFRQHGIAPTSMSALDRLVWLGTRTMGALTYHPNDEASTATGSLDLRQMAREIQHVLAGDAIDILPELLRAGGSPGGARPKILVGVQDDKLLSGEDDLPKGYLHWMVKFPGATEGRDAGVVEYAFALMAHAAGIDLPAVRLFELSAARRYFAAQRFDRGAGNQRFHVHSLANLVHSDFRTPSLDYSDLLRVTQGLTRDRQDVQRAFRRMLFNIAAHNRDDHGRNFAFLMNHRGDWTLAPAFDLSPNEGPGGEHSTTVQGEGRDPARKHVLALATQFGVRQGEALAMIDQVNTAVGQWPQFAEIARIARRRRYEVGAMLRMV